MSQKDITEFPTANEIKTSPYELDFIRRKISGMLNSNINSNIKFDSGHLALLELILCLSNEIAELKTKTS